MNNSGQAVVAVCRKFKIEPENVIVVYDDLYITKGTIKISNGGSGGGHNGIKSINQLLGTSKYIQIRIGIMPEKKVESHSNYVLSKIDWNLEIENSIEMAAEAAQKIALGEDIAKLQCYYNGYLKVRAE
jgi:PTH1 family peptidyl-tRNA hydrolase